MLIVEGLLGTRSAVQFRAIRYYHHQSDLAQ
jgi:hypothetical protein